MAISHHPDISTLMTCAAGSQPEALCAVVASHLSVCPDCFRKVGQLTRIGASLFDDIEPGPTGIPGVRAQLPQKGEPARQQHSWVGHGRDIPGPLTSVLGHSLDDIPWQKRAPGIDQFEIPLSPGAVGHLRLIRLAPGVQLSWCNEKGERLVMILRGGFCDQKAGYEAGDVEDFDEPAEHAVVANGDQGCVLLIASECEPQLLAQAV